MKINQKILSIPPYISTSWKNVISLHLEEEEQNPILIIGLVNGAKISVPSLDNKTLETIFFAHEKHLDQEATSPAKASLHFAHTAGEDPTNSLFGMPLQLGPESTPPNILQHNPEASDSPDLPKEVLEKISNLSKVVGADNADSFPKPEPHCNCMHCQIMRELRGEKKTECVVCDLEEEVFPSDLSFREWDIQPIKDNLYSVTAPFNKELQYTVFLGKPIGCTCGELGCIHLQAVLNSYQ